MKYMRIALFIDGRWQAPSIAETITIISLSTEVAVGVVPAAATAEVDTAVAAARRASATPQWRGLDPSDRAVLMRRFADALERRRTQTAAIVTDENGMPATLASTKSPSPDRRPPVARSPRHAAAIRRPR